MESPTQADKESSKKQPIGHSAEKSKQGSKLIVIIACVAGVALSAFLILREPSNPARAERPTVAAPVLVHKITREVIKDSIDALGTVMANEAVTLTSKVNERIESIRFEEGQRVKAGDLLISLNDREIVAQMDEAQAELVETSRQLERARSLIDSGAITESDIDERTARFNAAKARVALFEARMRDHRIRAPFDGIVGLRYVSPGEMVNSNAPLVTLTDSDVVKVDFTIPERYAGKIAIGMAVTGLSAAWTDEHFSGTVSGIDTVVDPVTRALKVRALIPNHEGKLKPGMLLKLNLVLDELSVVAIPESALAPIGTRQYVMRVREDGTAERVEVEVGRRYPGRVEIVSGLNPGDVIVTHGFRAQNGQKVRILQDSEVFSNLHSSGSYPQG